jgi:hypothetical protein
MSSALGIDPKTGIPGKPPAQKTPGSDVLGVAAQECAALVGTEAAWCVILTDGESTGLGQGLSLGTLLMRGVRPRALLAEARHNGDVPNLKGSVHVIWIGLGQTENLRQASDKRARLLRRFYQRNWCKAAHAASCQVTSAIALPAFNLTNPSNSK